MGGHSSGARNGAPFGARLNIVPSVVDETATSKRRIMADRIAILAYVGAVPFVAGAALTAAEAGPSTPYPPTAIVGLWALVITSFMAGAHWGYYLADRGQIDINLFLTSTIVAIVGWLAFLLLSVPHALYAFAFLFAVLLLIDRRLYLGGHIDAAYWRIRLTVTMIVIAALAVTAISA